MRFILPATLAALLPLSAQAATLFSESFDTVPVGNYQLGNRIGQFTVTQADVDLFGTPGTNFACPSNPVSGNTCLDLNGNHNGAIASDPLTLVGGTTYTVSFSLAGNGTPFTPSPNNPYTLDVSLGGIIRSFSVLPAAAAQTMSFDVFAATGGLSSLSFVSTSQNQPTYWGAILDDIVVTSPDAAAVPEPASWAMMVGGFGLLGAAMRRCRATTAAVFA